jgi:hypothetical protein
MMQCVFGGELCKVAKHQQQKTQNRKEQLVKLYTALLKCHYSMEVYVKHEGQF